MTISSRVCAATGLEPLTNQRRHKYLDKAVFEYAYAAIEQENDKLGEPARVDTCRGVYVRPGGRGRLWDSSWVEHDAFIGVPQSSEQKRTLSRAGGQVAVIIGLMQRPQLTLRDAVSQCERVTPQDVNVLVAQR